MLGDFDGPKHNRRDEYLPEQGMPVPGKQSAIGSETMTPSG